MVIGSPQNPTGATLSREAIESIFELAKKHNIYVISDEVYSHIVYDRPFISMAQLDYASERVIILNSFSKTYAMTGWRLGWSVAPQDIAEKLGLMVQTVISAVPAFIQYAGIAALEGDQKEVHAMFREYRERRELMVAGLNALPGVQCNKPDGAFYVFPNIQGTGLSSEAFAHLMLEHAQVAVLPGNTFGSMGEGFVRLSFATTGENIKEGITRMAHVLKSQ